MDVHSDDSDVYDVAVIGAGFIGSAAAYHLVKSGQTTLLLDQFGLPHTRGSSSGHRRCTTKVVPPPLLPLIEYSDKVLQELEEASGEKISHKTGSLFVDKISSGTIPGLQQMLSSSNYAHEMLTGPEITNRFPGLTFDDDFQGLLEVDSYIYRCDKVLRLMQDTFLQNGGTIKDLHLVNAVEPSTDGEPIQLQTSGGTLLAKSVVIAAGPWNGRLLKTLGIDIPTEVLVIDTVCYKEQTCNQYSIEKGFPWMMLMHAKTQGKRSATKCCFWHPSFDHPGSVVMTSVEDVVVDPDNQAGHHGQVPKESTLTDMDAAVRKHFPHLKPNPSVLSSDMATHTPDDLLVLDRHPKFENIVFATALSGIGFLSAPGVGKALCELVQQQQPSFDLTAFRMDRFDK